MKIPTPGFKLTVMILVFLIATVLILPAYHSTEGAPIKTPEIKNPGIQEPNINQTAALKTRAAPKPPAPTPNKTIAPIKTPTPTPANTSTIIPKPTARKTPIPAPTKTPEGYSLTAWLTKNNVRENSSDILISLSYPAPSLTLTCAGNQNTTKPILISNKGAALFKIDDNIYCKESTKNYAEYILPSGAKEKLPLRLNYTEPFEMRLHYK